SLEEVLKDTKTEKTVNIYLAYPLVGSGVLGRAKLIADALLERYPRLKIQMIIIGSEVMPYGNNFFNGNERLSVKHLTDTDFVSHYTDYMDSDLKIGIGFAGTTTDDFKNLPLHKLVNYPGFSIDFVISHPIGSVGHFSYGVSNYLPGIYHSDLNNTIGLSYFNEELYRRKLEKDTWDLARLKSERQNWLKNLENVTQVQYDSLVNHARQEGWDPLSSVWSFGYYSYRKTNSGIL
ncbi:MAG: hypothetical protein AAB116_02365, partial [Candidatus Poribacteria bacterium]